jgi:glycerophosphoryl diester phosphodiesterase
MIARLLLAILALALAAAPSAAQAAENPWLERRVLHFAHQGGEFEAPSSTMFAFHTALDKGADVLELDVQTTSDEQLVVIHDRTLDRTTNGSGPVREHTLAQIQALDAAYNFVPGRNAVIGLEPSSYPYRGVRSGAERPPAGFRRRDFRVPTLREVLRAFPHVPLNIEIKGDEAEALHTAGKLADVLAREGRMDVIVVSFNQAAVDAFHASAPSIPVAPGVNGMASYILGGGSPGEGVKAFQVPLKFTVGGTTLDITTPEFVSRAHRDGYAVHVWLDDSEENDATYARVLDMCVDAIMTAYPARFESFLRERRPPRPAKGGSDGCGPPPPPCSVRATALGQPGWRGWLTVRLARLDPSRRSCRGRVVLRSGSSSLGDGNFRIARDSAHGVARVKLNRRGRRLFAGPALEVTAIAKTRHRAELETFSLRR